MTKKYFSIFITLIFAILLLCCLAFAPNDKVFGSVKEDVAVSLSNPTAIASQGDTLYVADVIEEDNQKYTIIHLINDEGIVSLFADKTLKGETTDLAVTSDGSFLFLMQKDKIISYDLTAEQLTPKTVDAPNVSDIEASANAVFYSYTDGNFNYVGARATNNFEKEAKASNFYSSKIKFLSQNPNGKQQIIVYFEMSNSLYSTKLYVDSQTNEIQTQDENTTVHKDSTQVAEVTNLFIFGQEVIFCTPTTINGILSTDDPNLYIWQQNGLLAKDVAFAQDTLFVLCDYTTQSVQGAQNKYYQKPRILYSQIDIFQPTKPTSIDFSMELGASELNYNIPTYDISYAKVAYATGYPSNIIYTPTHPDFTQNPILSNRAIEKDKFSPSDNFLILAKSADEQYSYVFFDGRFGWIRNSDCIKTLPDVNNVSGIILVQSNVYSLPTESDDFLKQDFLPKLTGVTVTGEYNNFYLVRYSANGTTTYGYIFSVNVGTNSPKKEYVTYERKAANPVVGKQLEIYLTPETDSVENNYLLDANGNQITVKGGKEVRLYQVLDDGVCYVGVVVDNVLYKGYVVSKDLLKTYNFGMTNAQILATACSAILVVIIAYVVILRIRSKKMEAAREEANAKLNYKRLQHKDENSDENFFDVSPR